VTVGGRGQGLGKGVPRREVRVERVREGARVVPGLVVLVTQGLAREAPLGWPGGAGGVQGAGGAGAARVGSRA
jgi:hypothetical protein